jgi:CRISPR-associated protein Cas1
MQPENPPDLNTHQARRRIAAPTAAMLPRIGDSLSFLYLDMMRVTQDDTGVLAFPAKGAPTRRLRIPTAAISCLLLGPGTSITNPAIATLARHGTTTVFAGWGAVRCYAAITPSSQSSQWLEAQAAAWANPTRRLAVAKRMYQQRFPTADDELPEGLKLNTLRGLEGWRMKALYRRLAQLHGVPAFRRSYDPEQFENQDPVNAALTSANQCLYGIVHAAITALGCSPGLGFVHTGTSHAFVYDIADLYKAELTIPLAFSLHASEDPEGDARRSFRRNLALFRLMPRIVSDIQRLFEPDREPTGDIELTDAFELWDPSLGTVPSSTNHGRSKDDE